MNGAEVLQHKVFKLISEITQSPTFVIGGFVRDFLLKRNLKKDIDIVTEGSGIELAEAIANKLQPKPKISVYKRFGTAMFHYEGIDFEFVGARKESYTENSRKPSVENGTIKDDQNRRDFTINALAFSLHKKDFGNLIDPFSGVKDLENKIIRTPLNPEITFSDDPLRMLRAIRFACELNFSIEPKTLQAITKTSDRISIISVERITAELNKIIACKKPSVGFLLLEQTKLLQKILPEITALKGIEEIEGKSHKDNFYHTLEVVDNIAESTDNIWLRWAALLHDIGKYKTKKFVEEIGWTFHSHEFIGSKMVKKIFHRLRLPQEASQYVEKLVKLSSRPIALVDDIVTDAALRRLLFDAGTNLEDLFTLCKADITTKNETKQKRYKENFILVEKKINEVEERDKIRNFQPPISGEIIMETFDLKPQREVGIIKEAIKEAILDGKIENNYNQAYFFMLEFGKIINLNPKNLLEK